MINFSVPLLHCFAFGWWLYCYIVLLFRDAML